MQKKLPLFAAILVFILILAACGSPAATPAPTEPPETEPEPTATPVDVSPAAPTATLDPCTRPQLEEEVQRIHRHMREFDDASILASNMPREQLSNPIGELQRIRREAEDEQVPACISALKNIQVQHMNTVISTLIAFMGGTDQQTLDQGITLARQQHDEYTLELARLLGLTVVPATIPPPPTETPTP